MGLGVSSISDIGGAFAQNAKTLHDYYHSINSGILAIKKGYVLSESDLACRQYILDIACKGETHFKDEDLEMLETYSFSKFRELEKDGLVNWSRLGLKLTSQEHYFIRNICSAFDLYLGKVSAQQVFSKAV